METRDYLLKRGLIKPSSPVVRPVVSEVHYTPQCTLTEQQIADRVNKALNYVNATTGKIYTSSYSVDYLKHKDAIFERRAYHGVTLTDRKLREFGY